MSYGNYRTQYVHEPEVLRLRDVIRVTGLPRSTIYAQIKLGNFPPPVKLTTRNVGWLKGEVKEWVITRAKML
ncbi:MAG: AlpA family phage regulatory protein [Alphaproteobacteria bacterium]|nr:AlpA family phage regulatory protein [Alphaproteobacteria bacterium]